MEIIKQFGFAPIFPTLGFDHGRFSDGGKALRKHYLSNIHTSNMDASKSKEYLVLNITVVVTHDFHTTLQN